MAGELAKRVGVAVVGIPFAVFILYLGGWPMALLLALIAALGAWEFIRIARLREVFPQPIITVVAAALFLIIAGAQPTPAAASIWFWVLLTFLVLASAKVVIWSRGVEGRPLASAAAMVFGPLLTGGTLCYAIFLREGLVQDVEPVRGLSFVLYPLAVTWIHDTFAYFGGRRFGKHKLIPRVSPGKTVEGSAFGLIGAIITSVVYTKYVFSGFNIWAAVIGGVLIAGAAVVGDLAESLLKREAGVKDSGALLPGHGGVLDRFDALYFTLPVAFWFLYVVLHLGMVGE